MKFYNLLNYKIETEKPTFLNAINAQKPMAITLDGKIVEGEKESLPIQPYIFVGKPKSLVGSGLTKPTPLAKILGDNYEVKDEGDKISIYAGRAWQEVLMANEPFYLYQDTTSDGITEFTDDKLDDLIWYSCEFGINYREVAEFLEKSVDGTVVCIENENPYHFNGCTYVDSLEDARAKAFDFIKETLKQRIESGEIDLEDLEEDEEEALRFFKLL
ncbi:hypothetical protein [Hydrogenimonas cancrithermarum]|uniref:Uncharacterized protein n=1 Tax=Hydrogenimonas cancrithermarum TaxID=2993563 RepID=A0ABM8FK13_9BACT|nr:hypothetical protein [Hydrogenimonas cancrithermarum]BDY11980.1 hypothetical protein HCR_02920 [Hydrogenimonas cancrithermarum]